MTNLCLRTIYYIHAKPHKHIQSWLRWRVAGEIFSKNSLQHHLKPPVQKCPTQRVGHIIRGRRWCITKGYSHIWSPSPCPLLFPTGWIALVKACGHECVIAAGDCTFFSPLQPCQQKVRLQQHQLLHTGSLEGHAHNFMSFYTVWKMLCYSFVHLIAANCVFSKTCVLANNCKRAMSTRPPCNVLPWSAAH